MLIRRDLARQLLSMRDTALVLRPSLTRVGDDAVEVLHQPASATLGDRMDEGAVAALDVAAGDGPVALLEGIIVGGAGTFLKVMATFSTLVWFLPWGSWVAISRISSTSLSAAPWWRRAGPYLSHSSLGQGSSSAACSGTSPRWVMA